MLLPAPRPVQLAEFKRRPFQEFLEPVHPVCVGVQHDVDDDLTQFFVAMFLLVRTHFALQARDPCDSLKATSVAPPAGFGDYLLPSLFPNLSRYRRAGRVRPLARAAVRRA